MRFRKLRIAWSVGWGAMCLVLSTACVAIQYLGADMDLMARRRARTDRHPDFPGQTFAFVGTERAVSPALGGPDKPLWFPL